MTVPAVLVLIVTGPGLLALGLWTLRTRSWYDGVSAAEVLIYRVGGASLPTRTATDRRFARLHAWMTVILGASFTLCLAAVVVPFSSE
ncbi:hypothetical protein F1C10_07345 [Sphingomonas sp. NBWT7]|uniref:hypothetical protein n=1 Tax=Sphingomonas sp. NBWT7 TaxID=2596913 RepID=UPI00162A8985|nr:hypothetical protein [Sphingomonas sp. NBWT7]QNE31768.1 hypothetical protein F1C10_07345 [Sphingomonas sp. NBWT7]